MHRPGETPNPWGQLAAWPGWRALRETLHTLEQLLRQAGALADSAAGALDVADAIAALLDDPTSLSVSPYYRQRCPLRKADPMPAEGADMDAELLGWVDELARYVSDTPVLLEAGSTSAALGPALAGELPRYWQNRLTGVVRSVQQMLQAAGGRKSKNPGLPLPDLALPGEGPPAEPSHYVVPDETGYALILPDDAGTDDLVAAGQELALLLLRDLGIDAARLHLQLLTGEREFPRDTVCAALGLDRRKATQRHHHTTRCYEAIRRLQQVKLSLYRWSLSGGTLAYERTGQDLWHLKVQEYGQARVFEQGGTLTAHGEDWTLVPGAQSWLATLPAEAATQLAAFAHSLLTTVDGSRNEIALALGALLARAAGAQPDRPVTVAMGALLRLAGRPEEPADEEARRRTWQHLQAAIRMQRSAGWEPEPGAWYEPVRKYYGKRQRIGAPDTTIIEDPWNLLPQGSVAFSRTVGHPDA